MATYGPLEASQRESLAAVMAYSFATPTEMTTRWIGRGGMDNSRVVSIGDEVMACLFKVPMGVWFGGRSVPNVGVSGVAVAPAHRGAGVAKRLMVELLREAHEEGTAVSTLYPATIGLYRACGYELAGGHYRFDAKLEALSRRRSPATLREATDADLPALKALYRSARREDGNADRGPYIWDRVLAPRFEETDRFVVEEDGAITGYTCFQRKADTAPYHRIACTDLVATTAGALDRILDFFTTHRSFVKQISWFGGPVDPFAVAWPERAYSITLEESFMLRISHVELALLARGYPAETKAALTLDVDDPAIEGNRGIWSLAIEDGVPSVDRAETRAKLAVSIRGLAALYAGYLSATKLRTLGWITGDDAAVAEAERIFITRGPWLDHMF